MHAHFLDPSLMQMIGSLRKGAWSSILMTTALISFVLGDDFASFSSVGPWENGPAGAAVPTA